MLSIRAVLLFVCVSAFAFAQDGDFASARVFLYKSAATTPVVAGEDFVINYQLINNGDGAANSITISDRYDPQSFETVSNINANGSVVFTIDELVPGGQVHLNVTVKPKISGLYESTRARIRYNPSPIILADVEPDYRSGYSSSLGRVRIISAAEHSRNTSYHAKEWSIFGVLFAIPTLVPLYFWLTAKSATRIISTKRKAT